jgi:hypothetical protein
MLDLVLLARARREIRDVNPEAQVIGQLLQLLLPRARAIAVAAARIGRDEQRVDLRIRRTAHHRPLLADRGDGERGRVVVAAAAQAPLRAIS